MIRAEFLGQKHESNKAVESKQGDKVIFKGQSDDSDNPDQESEQDKIVSQMANKAMKK